MAIAHTVIQLSGFAAELGLAQLLATRLGEDPEHWPVLRLTLIGPWQETPGIWSADTPEWLRALGTITTVHEKHDPFGRQPPPCYDVGTPIGDDGTSAARAPMTSDTFDRIARARPRLASRRRVVAAIGAALGAAVPRRGRAQLELPSCGAAGEVCTHLMGCCNGLVCATSYINTSYGICVPGEGDMAPVSTTIVTPGSEAMVTEVAAELAQLAAIPPVDLQAERAAELAARREKHDTQLSRKRTKRKARRTRKQTRRDTQ